MSKQRTVVITGAYKGIGLALARNMAKAGDRVVLTARSMEKARQGAQTLADEGIEVFPEAVDVSSSRSVEDFFERLEMGFGRIDVLINNAGAFIGRDINDTLDVTEMLVLEGFNVNTLSAVRMMRRAIPWMRKQGKGRIVNVSSGLGGLTEMGGGHPAYRISKAALNAATRIYAHEAGDSIKINSVCPGWVQTDMGGQQAPRTLDEGIKGILWAANLPDDGPTGGFFRDGEALAW